MTVAVRAIPRSSSSSSAEDEATTLETQLNEGDSHHRLVGVLPSAHDGFLLAIFDDHDHEEFANLSE